MTEQSQQRNGTAMKLAWLVVALLVPVAMLNYLDRQMIAAMKTSVMADVTDIGTEVNWGRMLGQFKWVYAFLSPIGGYLADRFSRRFTICASLFAWSAITYATGYVESYSGLVWTRTLMGVSEAFYIPAALALIADYHVGHTRSRAIGFHQIGIYCGVLVGGFAGYAADSPAIGWQGAFKVVGMIGIGYAIPLLLLLRDPPRVIESELPPLKPTVVTSIQVLFTNPSFLLLVAYFTLPAMAGWVVRDWMPSILKDSFGIGQGLAGFLASFNWQIAAIFTAIGGGWWADRWMRKDIRARIYVSVIGMAMIIPSMICFGIATTFNLFSMAIVALILFGIGWGAFDCNNMPILSQIVRPEFRATGYGIMNFVSLFCGGLADWLFGMMRDRQTPQYLIFGIFAAIVGASAVLALLIRPRNDIELSG